MHPLLISHSDLNGGAARAAMRLHLALLDHDVGSRMRVTRRYSDLSSIDSPIGTREQIAVRLRNLANRMVMRQQHTTNEAPHFPALFPSSLLRESALADVDLVHLHWVSGGCLSIGEIGRIGKPLVWTLHDMWPFCGAEHYAPDGEHARWREDYRPGNRPAGHSGLDIDRWTWERKLRAWKQPITLVAPSHWLADCARGSALMHDWPVTVIPNVLDTRQFQPWPKPLARRILGLPEAVPLIVFGAIAGGRDPRKGWDLLQAALPRVARDIPDAECVIFGQSAPSEEPSIGIPIHWLGHLADDTTLSLVYSAADVMVVPSRQEAFGQTGSEAQSCGCPVVAFRGTGLPDVVDDRKTGYLAEPYDADDLANGIGWVLADAERATGLGANARARALRLWSPSVVVPQYLAVYEQVLDQFKSDAALAAGGGPSS